MENALPFVNTLVQRQCDVVLAGGGVPAEAVVQAADELPDTRFAVVGDPANAPNNVTVVSPDDSDQIQTETARLVQDLVAG